MALFRLVILGIALWFVYRAVIRLATEQVRRNVAGPQTPAAGGGATIQMRQCAHCGVHIPEGESTQSRGQYFCCEAHRDAFFAGRA